MAARQNVNLQAVQGSGPGGRIIKRDVEAFMAGGGATALRAVPAPSFAPQPGQEIALSSMRKVIAKRLSESAFSAPPFYVTVEIDMDKAVALREQVLAAQEVKVSYNDFIIKACAKALAQFPMVNASWAGEKIVTHGDVHVGVAVALPDGLITPVVRHADRKGIADIAREVRDLAGRAREKKLKPEEYSGSTFTISNLGMFDVDQFTAIINPPDSAILAVGSVKKVPVVDGDQIRPGHRMKLTMTSDHRVIDGALAAQFLQEVRRLLENPIAILL
jgi:pyruvate dehydrogenase E2 component (dihydrolipoamide acetyltransferase)